MKKRCISLLLAMLLLLAGCGQDLGVIGGADGPTVVVTGETVPSDAELPVYGEYYYDLENVVLYLALYDELPDNYITKSEARQLGWQGGSVEDYLEGAAK